MLGKKPDLCDSKSFEDVYKRYVKDVRRSIFYKTKDIEMAEDIVQETFIKLWDNCSRVNYEKVKSYIYTSANNIFLNIVKHQKVVRKHQKSIQSQKDVNSPEFIMLEKEFMSKIETVIASLPEKQREVFLLNRIENKKYKDISVLLNISVKAVEKRMHLALLTMRKEIGNV